VRFSFGNFGAASSSACTRRLQLDGGESWDISIPELSPGQQHSMFLLFPNGNSLDVGNHYVYAYLDINLEVNELTKNNNVSYNGFQVG